MELEQNESTSYSMHDQQLRDYVNSTVAYLILKLSLNKNVVDFEISVNDKSWHPYGDIVISVKYKNTSKNFAIRCTGLSNSSQTIDSLEEANISLLEEYKSLSSLTHHKTFKKTKFLIFTTFKTSASFSQTVELSAVSVNEWKKNKDEFITNTRIEIRRLDRMDDTLNVSNETDDMFLIYPEENKFNLSRIFLYTNQIANQTERPHVIDELLKQHFKVTETLGQEYMDYVENWYQKELNFPTKKIILLKLSELLLDNHIAFQKMVSFNCDNFDEWKKVVKGNDVIIFTDEMLKVSKICQPFTQIIEEVIELDFTKDNVTITEDIVDKIENPKIKDLLLEYIETGKADISLIQLYKIFWRVGKLPLIISLHSGDNMEYQQDCILDAISFMKKKGVTNKLMLKSQVPLTNVPEHLNVCYFVSEANVEKTSSQLHQPELEAVFQTKKYKIRKECAAFNLIKSYVHVIVSRLSLELVLDTNIIDFKISINDNEWQSFGDIVINVKCRDTSTNYVMKCRRITNVVQRISTLKDAGINVEKEYDLMKSFREQEDFDITKFVIFTTCKISSKFSISDECTNNKIKINPSRLENDIINVSNEKDNVFLIQSEDETLDVYPLFIYTSQHFESPISFLSNTSSGVKLPKLLGDTTFLKNYLRYIESWAGRKLVNNSKDNSLQEQYSLNKRDVLLTLIELMLDPYIQVSEMIQTKTDDFQKWNQIVSESDVVIYQTEPIILNKVCEPVVQTIEESLGDKLDFTKHTIIVDNSRINDPKIKAYFSEGVSSEKQLKELYKIFWNEQKIPLLISLQNIEDCKGCILDVISCLIENGFSKKFILQSEIPLNLKSISKDVKVCNLQAIPFNSEEIVYRKKYVVLRNPTALHQAQTYIHLLVSYFSLKLALAADTQDFSISVDDRRWRTFGNIVINIHFKGKSRPSSYAIRCKDVSDDPLTISSLKDAGVDLEKTYDSITSTRNLKDFQITEFLIFTMLKISPNFTNTVEIDAESIKKWKKNNDKDKTNHNRESKSKNKSKTENKNKVQVKDKGTTEERDKVQSKDTINVQDQDEDKIGTHGACQRKYTAPHETQNNDKSENKDEVNDKNVDKVERDKVQSKDRDNFTDRNECKTENKDNRKEKNTLPDESGDQKKPNLVREQDTDKNKGTDKDKYKNQVTSKTVVLDRYEHEDAGKGICKNEDKSKETVKIHVYPMTQRKHCLNISGDSNNTLSVYSDRETYSLPPLYIFTNQKIMPEMVLVHELSNFCHVDVSFTNKYIDYIKHWAEGKLGGNYFLTKRDVILKLGELLLDPYISYPNIIHMDSKNFEIEIWSKIVKETDVITINNEQFILSKLSQQFKQVLDETLSLKIDSTTKKVVVSGDLIDKVEDPEVRAYLFEECSVMTKPSEIHFIKLFKAFWKAGRIPLLISLPDNDKSKKFILDVISFMKAKGVEKKFMLKSETPFYHTIFPTNLKVFSCLDDIKTIVNLEDIRIRLSNGEYLNLKEISETDPFFLKWITPNIFFDLISTRYCMKKDESSKTDIQTDLKIILNDDLNQRVRANLYNGEKAPDSLGRILKFQSNLF